jgi:hypothetical protein
MLMFFISFLVLFIGISIAIKTTLVIQAVILLCGALYLNSTYREVAGIIGAIYFVTGVAGLIIGNLIYYFVYYEPSNPSISISSAIKWFFTP